MSTIPTSILTGLVSLVAGLSLLACTPRADTMAPERSKSVDAYAALRDADGNLVGDAKLEQLANGVELAVDVGGLSEGEHGFHIHETGSCVGPDFTSAGGHFNPEQTGHGFADADGAHVGDLPSLPVGADGKGEVRILIDDLTLFEGEGEARGHVLLAADDRDGVALVVHARPDDYASDPAGDAGPRVACGVIERVEIDGVE